MQRSLSPCGVGLLVLVLTAGMTFGHPPHHTQNRPSERPPVRHADKTTSFKRDGGTKEFGNNEVGTKKAGQKKVSKKSGNPKKGKQHHKHRKHRRRRHLGADGGADDGPDDSADGGASDPEVAGGTGLQIIDLDQTGPAAAAGLDVDDTILSVNRVRVRSVEELRAVVERAKGIVTVVFLSDETGEVEEVDITPKHGRLGITMDEVSVD